MKKVSLVVILGLVVLQVSVIEAKKAVSCVTRAPKVDRVKRNLTKKKLKNKRILMNYPYKLPELGYAFDALEPHIDKETMILHLTKHQQAYVNNLNAILENHPELQKRSLEDILRIIGFSFCNKTIDGPVNAVSPNPIKSKYFFSTVARKFGWNFTLKIPAILPKLFLKELVEELVLVDQSIKPKKLIHAKYEFFNTDLNKALDNILGS